MLERYIGSPYDVTAGQAQSQLVRDRTRVLGYAGADCKMG